MNSTPLPVVVVGAGPVGLITALGLLHYGIDVVVFEENEQTCQETRAGTILSRTLEVLDRYGAVDDVLRESLRTSEIADLEPSTSRRVSTVDLSLLSTDTRYPFIANIPQPRLESVLRDHIEVQAPGAIRSGCRVVGFRSCHDHVEVTVETATGSRTYAASHLLGCDGSRSTVRRALAVSVRGHSLEQRYMVADLDLDLDVAPPRDYPYLSYFPDPVQWLALIRLPHCWRFVFPLRDGQSEVDEAEFRAKIKQFIGDIAAARIVAANAYTVHHRVAERWRVDRVFLMGDAAHLITPMWALGLNTGALDASNLPWRLAWVLRGWAGDRLLAGYEHEQFPLAVHASAQLAATGIAYMNKVEPGSTIGPGDWGRAATRTLLGVRLDVEGTGDWSIAATGDAPRPIRVGDRVADVPLFTDAASIRLHDLCREGFAALYFTDPRKRPHIVSAPANPALSRHVVSAWDAPLESGLRRSSLFDPGDQARQRLGIEPETAVLVRPDGHVAAITRFDATDSTSDSLQDAYHALIGNPEAVDRPAADRSTS